jgi:hypothetical protein
VREEEVPLLLEGGHLFFCGVDPCLPMQSFEHMEGVVSRRCKWIPEKNVTDLQRKINFPYFPSQLVLCG